MVIEDSCGYSHSRNSKMLRPVTQGFWSKKLSSELHSQIYHIPIPLKQDNFTGKNIADKKNIHQAKINARCINPNSYIRNTNHGNTSSSKVISPIAMSSSECEFGEIPNRELRCMLKDTNQYSRLVVPQKN